MAAFLVTGQTHGPETTWYMDSAGCLWSSARLATAFNTRTEAQAAISLMQAKFPSVEFSITSVSQAA